MKGINDFNRSRAEIEHDISNKRERLDWLIPSMVQYLFVSVLCCLSLNFYDGIRLKIIEVLACISLTVTILMAIYAVFALLYIEYMEMGFKGD